MTLKINNWKTFTKRVIWTALGVIFIIFFVRIGSWESQYYSSQEGSPRAEAIINESEVTVDETEVTEAEISEYTVYPTDRPRFLTINSIGVVKARIIAVGVGNDDELGTPYNIYDVGWYDASGKPGEGGTMLLDGHNGGPTKIGVFKFLPEVKVGEPILVENGEGTVFTYNVVENVAVPLDQADAYMSKALESPVAGQESLTIITCTGEWSQSQQTYLSRQFLRATLAK